MARVSRKSASAVALVLILSASSAFAQTACENGCGEPGIGRDPGIGGGGSIRDFRDDRADSGRDNQRDPIVSETSRSTDFVFVAPPLFQLPASNTPVTRGSGGQIRSSWAVGVFR
jgi:hypothetical protein